MPLMNFPVCWRRRDDCQPFHTIEAVGDQDLTEEQFENFEYDPVSYVCCGCVAEAARCVPQDAYRVCCKNAVVDEMGDYDEQDLAHLQAVVSHALAVIATRRVNSGTVIVPVEEGLKTVETKQKSA